MNAISKFNNLGEQRKIIVIGLIQAAVFLTSFVLLVPYHGSLGAAYSILITYSASAAFSVYWFERLQRRYIATSVIAVIIGSASGYTISLILDYSLIIVISSVVTTLAVVLALRNTSTSEIRQLIKSIVKPRESL